MPVSALTKNLCCCITFYPSYCVFQDLRTGQRIGGGTENNGLYILDLKRTEPKVLQTGVVDDNSKLRLWHRQAMHQYNVLGIFLF